MLRRIWQAIARWFQGLFGGGRSPTPLPVRKEPPKSLTDTDYDFLFGQLLEGVSHGWQRERVLQFFAALKGRATAAEWVAWLRGFGERVLASPAPNNELASRMVALGELGVGEIGDVAIDIGMQLLMRQPGYQAAQDPYAATEDEDGDFRPIYEYEQAPSMGDESQEAPQPQQVTLDELLVMLQQDPALVEQIASQLQIDTTDPQVIVEELVRQFEAANQSAVDEGEEAVAVPAYEGEDDPWREEDAPNIRPIYEYEEAPRSEDETILPGLEDDNPDAPQAKQVSLDELLVMLQQDPALVEQIASQLQIETTDPETLVEELARQFEAANQPTDDAQGWFNQGVQQYEAGDLEGAIASYDRALEMQPDAYVAWNNRGIALSDLGLFDSAIASYDRALQIKPDDHEAWNNRGLVLSDLGRFEEAIASYDRALQLKLDDREAWANRGNALSGLGRLEEAISSYDRALQSQLDSWQVWINRGDAAFGSPHCDPLLTSYSEIAQQNPAVNQRGYEGQLASYEEGLNYVRQDTDPEGWGKLHQSIGLAHYNRGRLEPQPRSYWLKAVDEYHEALQTLTESDFPEAHLEVLQDLIQPLLGLGKTGEAQELGRRGSELLRYLLNDPNLSDYAKNQLTLKFVGFYQLTVDIAVQSNQLVQAWEIAEQGKNACLAWLIDGINTNVGLASWNNIKQLLDPSTAIVYWHLSPASLTTFILKHDAPEPIVLGDTHLFQQTGVLSTQDNLPASFRQLYELEEWVKDWNQQYQEYRKTKQTEAVASWRDNLTDSLSKMAQILNIEAILPEIDDVNQLILIPHRDLHRFPLHAVFPEKFAISYLPSAQIGLNVARSGFSQPIEQGQLLSVENPKSAGQRSLVHAELEAAAIAQMFDNPTRIASTAATKSAVENALQAGYNIFHFTGHGTYNSITPSLSALALSGKERLTVEDICRLSLGGYQLVSLSACETAVTGNQTITTEYVGLATGFMRAGVAHVVSTLWTVQAASGALLMIQFYKLIKEGAKPREALKQAQMWLRTVTYSQLADWYQDLAGQLEESDRSASAYLGFEALILQENPDKLNSPEPPYAHPYHWAAYTISG